MKEDLLHFIWQSKFLLRHSLILTSGIPVEVLQTGMYNRDAGPDFLNARVRIGDTLWVGNIEFHVQSSDWIAHQHHQDDAYNNVILHIVYHHDRPIYYANHTPIPTLELRHYLPPILLKRYAHLQQSKTEIPCYAIFEKPESIKLLAWFDRLLVNRLERKTEIFRQILHQHQQHWEEAFYVYTARYMGSHTNAQPFEWLAERIPLQIISRHKNRPDQLMALCFGVSGFLNKPVDEKHNVLSKEYSFLKSKYGLQEVPFSAWKFSRTRPANFPTTRITQWVHLLHASTHLFSKVIRARTLEELKSGYRVKVDGNALLSEQAIDHLLINAVLPVLFLYGQSTGDMDVAERILSYFDALKPENNRIIRFWQTLKLNAENAAQSQALIEQKTRYCDALKCVDCAIGQHLLLHETNT